MVLDQLYKLTSWKWTRAMGLHPVERQKLFGWNRAAAKTFACCVTVVLCVWPLRCLKLFGESLQMGIRSGCGRRIQEQETAPFLFCQKGLMEKLPNICVNVAKEQSKGRGEKKEWERSKHQRASPSSLRMLFILLTGLLTSPSLFSKVSLGAHFMCGAPWSPHSACIQSGSCIIYECCGC